MISETLQISSPGNISLFIYKWLPDVKENTIGVVQIAHGMVEHAGRYKGFAEILTQAGWAVYAGDHRGHGKTMQSPQDAGFFADQNGWDRVVDDLATITEQIESDFPTAPIVLFGHSMGSFLSRHYTVTYGKKLTGVIFSATGGGSATFVETSVGSGLAKLVSWIRGPRHRSKLITALVFGPFNSKIKPKRTIYDWLSRDPAEVDKYINDPHCGFICTASFYLDLFHGVRKTSSKRFVSQMPVDLPMLFIAGDADPVGKYGKGVQWVIDRFKNAGCHRITRHFYENGRHELLNDIQKEQVHSDILNWLSELKK